MTPNQSDRHSLAEDAFAIATGTLLVSLGVVLYARATLLVGGSSGLALLIQYATGMNFWAVFSIANFPFYALAVARMGCRGRTAVRHAGAGAAVPDHRRRPAAFR